MMILYTHIYYKVTDLLKLNVKKKDVTCVPIANIIFVLAACIWSCYIATFTCGETRTVGGTKQTIAHTNVQVTQNK